jgi:hypothetical protein
MLRILDDWKDAVRNDAEIERLRNRIEALEAALREATLILEQAQCCIMQETPEDMTFGEAEDDTLSKIRAFLNRAALEADGNRDLDRESRSC